MAINESYKNDSGEKKERVLFVTVDVWDKLAELCCQYVGKGSPVLVGGALRQDEWDDTKTGVRMRILKVRADKVIFLGSRKDSAAGSPEETGLQITSTEQPLEDERF